MAGPGHTAGRPGLDWDPLLKGFSSSSGCRQELVSRADAMCKTLGAGFAWSPGSSRGPLSVRLGRAGGGRDGAGAPPGAGCRMLAVLLRVVPLTRRAAVPAPPRPPASVRPTGPDDFDLIAPLMTSWPPPHSLQLSQCFCAAWSDLLPIFLWGFCLFLVSLQECRVYFNCESFVSFSHCGYFLLLY